ncbi:MAG: hypothetical protein ACK40X_04045 [Armatimonadota bacterium]
MKARFEVTYHYDPDEAQRFVAIVVLGLPTEDADSTKLHTMFQSSVVSVFDELLGERWGSYDGNTKMRWSRKRIKAGSWEEAKAKAEEVINEAVEVLRRVKEENEKALQNMPQTCVYEFEL